MSITVLQVTTWYSHVVSIALFIGGILGFIANYYNQSSILLLVAFIRLPLEIVFLFTCLPKQIDISNQLQLPIAYFCKFIGYSLVGIGIGYSYYLDNSAWWVVLLGILVGLNGICYLGSAFYERQKIRELSKISAINTLKHDSFDVFKNV
jgi:hypothetical protein